MKFSHILNLKQLIFFQ